MKPLRLEVRGFTCFRQKTSVELDGLELFAIAGPTGSGKTTLLDAITYALYGQTARLGKQGLDVLISPGETHLAVSLDFLTARGTYRVVRTADRKPSGKVERNTRIFELAAGANWRQLPESEKLKEADEKLEQLVGLDYDGFTRSVLLPQGAFDEFLRGDAAKRRKLLVSLLGLDRIEQMQRAAGRKARDAELRAATLKERLEQDYAGATPERRRELRKTLSALQQERAELSERQVRLSEQLQGMDEVKALLDEQKQLEERLEKLRARSEAMAQVRRRLEQAKRAERVLPRLEALEQVQGNLQRLEQALQRHAEEEAAARRSLQEAKVGFDEQQRQCERRLPALEAHLARLAGVLPLLAQLTARGGTLALAAQAEPGQDYDEVAWDEVQRLRAWLPGLRQALELQRRAEQALQESQAALRSLGEEERALGQALAETKQAGAEARTRLNEAKGAYEQAALQNQAAALRAHLHPGDDCPVCLRTIERLPDTAPSDLVNLKRAQEAAQQQLEALLERYQQQKARLEAFAARKEDRQAAVTAAEESLSEARRRVAEVRLSLAQAGDDLPSDPEAIAAALSARQRRLLAALAARIAAQTDGADPAEAERRLKREKQQLEAALKTAEQQWQQARSGLERLVTQREERESRRSEAAADLARAQQALDQALAEAGFATAQEVRDSALRAAEMSRLESDLATYEHERDAAERREVELRARLAGRSLDEGEYLSLKAEQQQVGERLGELQKASGQLERDLEHVSEQLERAARLREESKEASATFDTYRQLSLDLRGNAFPEFLLGQLQSRLARRASHILREVTSGRYDLRLIDGEYQVLDAWHIGEPRHAKTLSGGETFIASLALALALSDTIAGHALGALFLDEGFGTLDGDTLNAVAGVLETLTHEGRMVGVITHVQALTERLPARLTVSKGPEGSSLSWDLA